MEHKIYSSFLYFMIFLIRIAGDGIKPPGGIKLSPDGFVVENMLVPGLPNAAISIKSCFNLFIPAVLLISNLYRFY